jgi:lactoylglutathione lyase
MSCDVSTGVAIRITYSTLPRADELPWTHSPTAREIREGLIMGAAIGELGPPVLFIEDVERSKAFYVDTLGFTLGFEDSTSAGLFVGDDMFMVVTVPSAEDMLTGETLSTPTGQRATGLFNIFVENVDEAFATLRAKGVEFIVDPIDRYWGRRTAHFKDPDGFVWEISQSIE